MKAIANFYISFDQAVTNDIQKGKRLEEIAATSAYKKDLTASLARRVAGSSR